MDNHVHMGVWCVGWLSFGIIFVILALIYYLIDTWYYENDNNNNDSEILVFNEDNTDICVIYVFDSDSYYVIEDIQ